MPADQLLLEGWQGQVEAQWRTMLLVCHALVVAAVVAVVVVELGPLVADVDLAIVVVREVEIAATARQLRQACLLLVVLADQGEVQVHVEAVAASWAQASCACAGVCDARQSTQRVRGSGFAASGKPGHLRGVARSQWRLAAC